MSQIDKIIYIPLLFWFILLILIFYSIIFIIFLSQILSINKVRVKYINLLLKISANWKKILIYLKNVLIINHLKSKKIKLIKIKKF